MKREPPDSLVANIVSIGLRNLADTRATSGTLVAYVAVTSAMGQSETNVTTEPWSAVEWIADADLTRDRSIGIRFHIAEIRPVRAKFAAEQFHARIAPNNAIPNRLALTAEESVRGVTGATAQVNQETPPMRIYIIGNDGITLCREPPTTVNKGDVAGASRDELHAARLSGKRLLALWNALPGVEKQTEGR